MTITTFIVIVVVLTTIIGATTGFLSGCFFWYLLIRKWKQTGKELDRIIETYQKED